MIYREKENDLGAASKIIRLLREDKQVEVSERTISRFGYAGSNLNSIMNVIEYTFLVEKIDYLIEKHRVTGETRYIMK
jgi:hypothetical protein